MGGAPTSGYVRGVGRGAQPLSGLVCPFPLAHKAPQRLPGPPKPVSNTLVITWYPRNPSGGPGTIPKNPEHFPVAKIGLPIYKSLPSDHSGTTRDIQDLIRDSEQPSVTTYNFP